jgi:hypothetical protein
MPLAILSAFSLNGLPVWLLTQRQVIFRP